MRPGNRISRRRSDQFAKQVVVADRQRRWRMQPKPQPIQAMDRSRCWFAPNRRLAGGQKEKRILPAQRRESFRPPGDAKTEFLIEAYRIGDVASDQLGHKLSAKFIMGVAVRNGTICPYRSPRSQKLVMTKMGRKRTQGY